MENQVHPNPIPGIDRRRSQNIAERLGKIQSDVISRVFNPTYPIDLNLDRRIMERASGKGRDG